MPKSGPLVSLNAAIVSLNVADSAGWLLYRQGDLLAAKDVLAKVLEELPDNAWANYHNGILLAEMGEIEAAKPLLRKAIATPDATFDQVGAAMETLQMLDGK